MKEHRIVGAFAALILALCFAGAAQAQTRSTPCDPATPNNAACISYGAVTTRQEGTSYPSGTVVSYRTERQTGSTWTALGTVTATRYYAQNLAYGTHVFRVFAIVNGLTSDPSNTASRDNAEPPPSAPIITIAVVISADKAPVYRVIAGNQRGDFAGLVPVGRTCEGQVLFRFREKSYRRVAVKPEELEGLSAAAVYAAPCAKRA
jgi:hypothetical protein